MKTTEEISNEIEMFEDNNLSGYDNKKEKDFVRFYNKIWYSKEDVIKYIKKVEMRYNQYFNNEKESNYNRKIKEDAYEIFGDELK